MSVIPFIVVGVVLVAVIAIGAWAMLASIRTSLAAITKRLDEIREKLDRLA